MKATLLTTQDGDWEGLYIEYKLFEEGHKIAEEGPEKFWLELSQLFDLRGNDLDIIELNYEDNKQIVSTGNFPPSLFDLSGDY